MQSVSEALAAILQEVTPLEAVRVPLEEAEGRVLCESIVADRDIPPFDKSLMDGFALRKDDLKSGATTFKIVAEVTAGQVPDRAVGADETVRIMTGAMLPSGADTVIKQEEVEIAADAATMTVGKGKHKRGDNVLAQGAILKKGASFLQPGRRLSPVEVGAIAEMGCADVLVGARPQVYVLATGDELVPFQETPGVGQIRNSNEVMLSSLIRRAGGEVHPLGIARDNPTSLAEKISIGLRGDVLVLSGGVSTGVLDLVPSQLANAGVKPILHQVWMKPGKPIWFGVLERKEPGDDAASAAKRALKKTYVFGLPGNPVSSLAGFELFVKSALKTLARESVALPQPRMLPLADEFRTKGDRPTYQPVRCEWSDSGQEVYRIEWKGSADLQGAARANAMALFEPREKAYKVGERVPVYFWE